MPPHVVGHDSYSCRFLIFCLPGPVAGRGRGGWTGLDWTEIGGSGDEIFCYPVLFTTPPSPSFPTRSSSAMLLALLTTAALLGTSGAMHTEHADALDTPDVHRNAHFRHAHVNEVAGGGGVFFAGEADKHVEGVNFHSAEASRHNADKLKRTYMRFDRNTRIERPVDSLDELDPPSPPPLSRAAILARARRRGHHHHHGDGDGDGDDDGDGGEVHSNHAAHAHVPHSHAHHGNLAAVLGAAAPPPVLRPRQGKLLISDPSGSGSDSMVEIPQSRRFQEDIAAYRMEHRYVGSASLVFVFLLKSNSTTTPTTGTTSRTAGEWRTIRFPTRFLNKRSRETNVTSAFQKREERRVRFTRVAASRCLPTRTRTRTLALTESSAGIARRRYQRLAIRTGLLRTMRVASYPNIAIAAHA